MNTQTKIAYGTREWFEMIGQTMCNAARAKNLGPDVNYSLVEHFVDGDDWGDGMKEGFRLDIEGGQPRFQVGAKPGEMADLTINVTRNASRQLNTMHGYDPEFEPAIAKFMGNGEFTVVQGDLNDLFELIGPIHDTVVDRTA